MITDLGMLSHSHYPIDERRQLPDDPRYQSVKIDEITPCTCFDHRYLSATALETGVDATTLDEYTFTVPDVSPTSKIYFLQFTPNTGNATQVTWTTRFTVSSRHATTLG